MILCFTGTGNSLFVAKRLSEKLDDGIVSINDVLKKNLTKKFTSFRPFVIVCPIYAWRIPRVVEQFIKDAMFLGNKEVYFVVTMGSQSGASYHSMKKLIEEKFLNFKGLSGVVMPDNCVSLAKMKPMEQNNEIIQKSIAFMDEIAGRIHRDEPLLKNGFTPFPLLKSYVINPLFYRHFVTDENFVVSSQCIGCGKCASLCPVNNIQMVKNVPTFKHQCIHCYACIHHCPKQAINIEGKTEKRGRYVCPDYPKK